MATPSDAACSAKSGRSSGAAGSRGLGWRWRQGPASCASGGGRAAESRRTLGEAANNVARAPTHMAWAYAAARWRRALITRKPDSHCHRLHKTHFVPSLVPDACLHIGARLSLVICPLIFDPSREAGGRTDPNRFQESSPALGPGCRALRLVLIFQPLAGVIEGALRRTQCKN